MTLPARLRDYEIWGRLGEGGMSEVWLGRHTVLAVPVVLKTIRGQMLGWCGGDRVIDEARLMARITNPRVVRALDAGEHDGTPYLVQEYVDGIDLAELDRRRRAALGLGLPLWFVCHVTRQALSALHAAHQAGVIHRDVKPSNLFGAPETGVRLGDFGIASAVGRREMSGTLRFMAPEQLREGISTRQTDVWGAAATACDLRYGSPPFPDHDAILAPDAGPRMPPPASPEEAFFQHVLRHMLAKDPAARPATMLEPLRRLDDLAASLRGAHRAAFRRLGRNQFKVGECEVVLRAGDIAEAQVDAIVNSANYRMQMRSGVGDALRRRGGDAIEVEAMEGGERALGMCVATGAGTLSARWVLHAVSAWNEASCVGRATQRALLLTDELGLRSIAFPALGTGVARVTMEICANAMMTALRWHVLLGGTRLRKVEVVLENEEKLAAYRDVAADSLGADEHRGAPDLGLPVDDVATTGESPTRVATGREDQG